MRIFRIDVRYDGTDFAGWQVQPGLRTVQGEIEGVLAEVLREGVRVRGSGRTDAGVHALVQVADFSSATDLPAEVIARALRGLLPPDVTALSVTDAPDGFDARRSATHRVYRYRILRGRDPLLRRYCWGWESPLDVEAMGAAARCFLGPIDATAFAASTRKGMDNRVDVSSSEIREDGPEVVYEIRANRFVHHMVRNIVGTLVEVGRGAYEADRVPDILAGRDRTEAGRAAPAHGLYLVEVGYGADPPSARGGRR